ncbi:SusE domain-containing protein [Corallibacter sp.]|uniref:SusE domain-containing protein n=1 Tax=Corallibacter sp. TaxID=2038084 RepID=UPI003AB35F9F
MKNLLKTLFFTLSIILISCNDDNNFGLVTPQSSFTIVSPNNGASLFLNNENEQNTALTLVWSDNFTNSDSYTIEVSTAEDFTEPIAIGTSTSNTFSLSVVELNNILLNYEVSAFEETPLYIRVNSGEQLTDYIELIISTYPEENPVIISPDSTFEVVLSDITENESALTVEWDDPDFSVDTSAEIDYYIEIAVAGSNFVTIESLGNTQDRVLESTHGSLNEAVLSLGLNADAASQLDLRVRSVIETANGNLERISDFITITVTPYETALPPVIYGVGAGMPNAGWAWDTPQEFILQGAVYSGNVTLSPDNGGNFRFFAQQDWGPISYNFPYYEVRGYTIDSNLINALDGDSNFQFIGTAGEYLLEIDTENKTITLGPPIIGPNCEFDQLWLVGAGVPDAGWGWETAVQLPCTGTGVYSGNVTLQNNGGADNNFRFFTTEGDWGSGQNFPYFEGEGYTIDSNFTNALDGDSNFAFTGTTGEYFLSVDTVNKTIVLDAAQVNCEFDQLWLVGAGVPDAGWGWDSPIELACTGAGVYSADVTFANNAFRFFTTEGDWGSGRNFPYYEGEGYTIDSNFVNALDGDSNFQFVGTPGSYTLTMDTVNKTISIQ